MVEKIDANVVGLLIAEELTPKVLPASPVWYTREPNSFDEFGGTYAMTARRPFNPSRQRKKGNITDLDAQGGYNEDLTPNNMQRLLQGFFFANIRETPKNCPFNGTQRPITAVSGAGLYTGAGTNAGFAVGHMVEATGFTNNGNNGVFLVSAVAASTITVTNGAAVAEAAPPAGAKIEAVGFSFAAGDVTMTIAAGVAVLTATVGNFNDKGLVPGSWVFVGGDVANTFFATVPQGYARIAKDGVAAKTLTFDKTTFVAAADNGAGKSIQIYFGNVLKNEKDPTLIIGRSYTQERLLGNDGVGIQAEYILGSVSNELTWNSPLPAADSKVNLDLGYIATLKDEKTGTQGRRSAAGGATVVDALGEAFFNTSNNVYQIRMNIVDPLTLNPTALFAKVTEWNATINNNVSPNKAQGELGAFDTTAGMFDVDLTPTVYFRTVAAIAAIRNNSDVTFHAIYSKNNSAIVIDFPLLALGGGQLQIEMDEPIMVPLEAGAAESPFGHTLCLTFLSYVPTVGVNS